MKKKIIVLSSLIGFGAYIVHFYDSLQNPNVRNTLLMENIEALSTGEIDPSECQGPKQYRIAGVQEVRFSSRMHSPDSMDIIQIFEARICEAEGFGDMEGNNEHILNYEIVETKREKCNGQHYHVPF